MVGSVQIVLVMADDWIQVGDPVGCIDDDCVGNGCNFDDCTGDG